MLENFKLSKYNLILEAKEPMLLPEFKGSMFRGGFGHTLRSVCCSAKGQDCKECLLKGKCPYAYIFETSPQEDARHFGGNKQVPRPYIFEPPMDGKREFKPGEKLGFGMILIGKAVDYLPYFIYTVKELGNVGITKRRHKYKLVDIIVVDELSGGVEKIYSSAEEMVYNRMFPITFGDCAKKAKNLDSSAVNLRFVSPVRIKCHGKYIVDELSFEALIQNLTIRINALNIFHCDGKWDDSLKNLRERAAKIKIVRNNLNWVGVKRFSNRQNKMDTLSGLMGEITYEGNLKEFLPLLMLGQFIHVGSDSVFGCGKYQIVV